MNPAAIADLLSVATTMTVATMGPNGRPHLVPMWFTSSWDGDLPVLSTWTYGKSQKAVNLGRDRHATILVETGDRYDQLRGISAECDVTLETEIPAVATIGIALGERYSASAIGDPVEFRAMVEKQAGKRVGLRFHPTRIASWDHRELGGKY